MCPQCLQLLALLVTVTSSRLELWTLASAEVVRDDVPNHLNLDTMYQSKTLAHNNAPIFWCVFTGDHSDGLTFVTDYCRTIVTLSPYAKNLANAMNLQ
ncbi:hypothetical protein BKA70DRAFT_1283272 [Coprinopsis sp. MPI-PUGE-AT-0042]|nr:hypothetical protein BKA70DRAFT_1283272 [Coprinopsis sp. MPI-PUGE-AT-0042]